MRAALEELTQDLPEHEQDPSFFADWADPRQYSLGDIGKGECAGEVVTAYEFAMANAERLVFDSQVKLEENNAQEAGQGAYQAMLGAAKALVQIQYDDVTSDPEEVVEEFKERFFDTELFFDPFAGPKFANYFFAAHENAGCQFTNDSAHVLIEEAQLFIEAVHTCYNKIRTEGLAAGGGDNVVKV